jgi:hypothetical protein
VSEEKEIDVNKSPAHENIYKISVGILCIFLNHLASGKVKVKLSLCLTKHHAVKTVRSGCIALHILNLNNGWR